MEKNNEIICLDNFFVVVTFGDMEIPFSNIDGMWETVDVTNDSWGYAWYDKNWKSPKPKSWKGLTLLPGTL